jgi:hypothetical protein
VLFIRYLLRIDIHEARAQPGAFIQEGGKGGPKGSSKREIIIRDKECTHFKLVPARGKRRIQKKPRASEINVWVPRLDAEILLVKPQALVYLGATAAQSLLGKDFSVKRRRGAGRFLDFLALHG